MKTRSKDQNKNLGKQFFQWLKNTNKKETIDFEVVGDQQIVVFRSVSEISSIILFTSEFIDRKWIQQLQNFLGFVILQNKLVGFVLHKTETQTIHPVEDIAEKFNKFICIGVKKKSISEILQFLKEILPQKFGQQIHFFSRLPEGMGAKQDQSAIQLAQKKIQELEKKVELLEKKNQELTISPSKNNFSSMANLNSNIVMPSSNGGNIFPTTNPILPVTIDLGQLFQGYLKTVFSQLPQTSLSYQTSPEKFPQPQTQIKTENNSDDDNNGNGVYQEKESEDEDEDEEDDENENENEEEEEEYEDEEEDDSENDIDKEYGLKKILKKKIKKNK